MGFAVPLVAVAVAVAAAGVALAPVVAPVAVHAAGFGASGIQAGSWAASFMSSYGGTVGTGSACALLQSIGAAGIPTAVVGAVEATAVGLGLALGKFFF